MQSNELEIALFRELQKANTFLGFVINSHNDIVFISERLIDLCNSGCKNTLPSVFLKESFVNGGLGWPIDHQSDGKLNNISLKIVKHRYVLKRFPIEQGFEGFALVDDSSFEKMYLSLFQYISSGILILNAESFIIDANPMACKMLGLIKNQLIGLHINKLTNKNLVGLFSQDNGVDAQHYDWHYDFKYELPNGNSITIEASCGSFLGTNIDHTIIEIKDVTLIRQNEDRINMLLTAIEQSPSSIVITNNKGIIDYVNPRFTEVTGYTSAEAIGKNPSILKTDITPISTYEDLYNSIENGKVWRGEFVNRKKDGSLYYEDAIISPIINHEKKITHYLAIKHDVSQLKIQAVVLKENLARLNTLIDSTSDRIWSIDNNLRISAINSHFKNDYYNAFGVRLDIGVYCMQGNPKFLEDEWKERYLRVISGESFSTEDFFDLPQNKKWVTTSFNPVYSDNRVIGAVMFSRDTSDVKRNELDIKANQARLKSLIDNTSDSIWSVDNNYCILAINKQMEAVFELAFNFKLTHGSNILNCLPRPVAEMWKGRYDRALLGNCFSEVDYFEIENQGVFNETSFNPIVLGEEVVGVSCFSRDITNQKVYENSLRDSERQLKTIFNTVESGICLVDARKQQITYANGYLMQLMELDRFQLEGQPASVLNFQSSLKGKQKASKQNFKNISDKLLLSNSKEVYIIRSQTEITLQNTPYILHSIVDLSAQKEQEQIIKALNSSALKLISFKALPQIHRYLRHEILNFMPNSIVLLGLFNSNSTTQKIKAIDGDYQSIYLKFRDILNVNPIGLKVQLPSEYDLSLKTGRIFEFKGGLKTLFSSHANVEAIEVLEKHFSITNTYAIGIGYQNTVFGTIYICRCKNSPIEHPYYIETLIYQASVAWQRNLLEAQLISAKTEAEKANVAKSVFIANLGHEIRTPLNAVIGLSDILYKQAQDPKSLNYLASIISGGKTVLNIINDLLDLSKIEAGEMLIAPHATDMAPLIEEMRHIFIAKAHDKGIELYFEINKLLPSSIVIDDLRIRQILLNLIDNAIKFTHIGYVCVKVDFEKISSKRINLIISVADTGIGIRKEMQQKVFLAFKQQDEQDNRKYGGTGLGLSISLKLIKMMGGQIKLQSEPNKGSLFTIFMPNIEAIGFDVEAISSNMAIQADVASSSKLSDNIFPPNWNGSLEELKKLINSEVLVLLQTFATKPSLLEVEMFSQIIVAMGEQYEVELLVKYGTNLQAEISNFEIMEMRQTLKNINNLCLKIIEL